MIGLATAVATMALVVKKLLTWSDKGSKQKNNEAEEIE
jgi:hypothetical protein